tara:strand:- start:418 stop:1146 length:729 start_codon:yes stop_codon:yes gene_type:complete
MIPKYLFDISNDYNIINFKYTINTNNDIHISNSKIYSLLETYKIDHESLFFNNKYIIHFRNFNKYIFYAGKIIINSNYNNSSTITFKYYHTEWLNFIKYFYNLILSKCNFDLINNNYTNQNILLKINYKNNHLEYFNNFKKLSNIIFLFYIIDSHLYNNYKNYLINYIILSLKNKSYILNTISLIMLNKILNNKKNITFFCNDYFKKYLIKLLNKINSYYKHSQFNRLFFINLYKCKKKLNL